MSPEEEFDDALAKVLDAYHDHILAMMENSEDISRETADAFIKVKEGFIKKWGPSEDGNFV